MLKRTDPIETNFGLTLTDTVWRWLGEQADILGAGQIVLGMFADEAAALSYDARDPNTGALLPVGTGAGERKIPLGELRVTVDDGTFAAMIMTDWPGANLSERLTKAIYSVVRQLLPEFADAVDV